MFPLLVYCTGLPSTGSPLPLTHVGAKVAQSESGCYLGEQGKPLLGIGVCLGAMIGMGLLHGHSFSTLACISFI